VIYGVGAIGPGSQRLAAELSQGYEEATRRKAPFGCGVTLATVQPSDTAICAAVIGSWQRDYKLRFAR
jgi:hypothetical protein